MATMHPIFYSVRTEKVRHTHCGGWLVGWLVGWVGEQQRASRAEPRPSVRPSVRPSAVRPPYVPSRSWEWVVLEYVRAVRAVLARDCVGKRLSVRKANVGVGVWPQLVERTNDRCVAASHTNPDHAGKRWVGRRRWVGTRVSAFPRLSGGGCVLW